MYLRILSLVLPPVELKSQPEPSAVLSQLSQRQQQSVLPAPEPSVPSLQHAPQVPTQPGTRCSLDVIGRLMRRPWVTVGSGDQEAQDFISGADPVSKKLNGCSSGHESSLPPARDGASPGVKGMDPPISEPPQRQMKTQKRRIPLPSKVRHDERLV
jgi:hypothetical protein